MDIKKLQPEAEITCALETTGEPVTIMFRVGFIPLDAVPDYVNESRGTAAPGTARPRISDILRRAVSDAIRGWDLMDGGMPLPCTQENKDKYLPLLFGLKTKRPEVVVDGEVIPTDPVALVLVRVLAEFAGNPENFLKN
jgi:hypothetical protein